MASNCVAETRKRAVSLTEPTGVIRAGWPLTRITAIGVAVTQAEHEVYRTARVSRTEAA